jgi:MarR family transcriptional regulator, organic hydroperoxide resistance regulator
MFDYLMRSAPDRRRALGRRGLTPNDARAMASLHRVRGRTMRSLAEEWECDASNATWIVNRLENLRLAKRRTASHDRRVTLVVLTAKGVRTRAALMADFYAPPTEFLALRRADLDALRRALDKLPSA